MKSHFLNNRGYYILFLISSLIYFLMDLISLSLQPVVREYVVILWLLGPLLVFISLIVLLGVTIVDKFKNPAVLVGVVAFGLMYFSYWQFSDFVKAGTYLLFNQGDLESLVQEVSIIDSDILRREQYDTSITLVSYWDVYDSDNKRVQSLMEKLRILTIKRHGEYTEMSISGYSSVRTKDLTLVHLTEPHDEMTVAGMGDSRFIVSKGNLMGDWRYFSYHFWSLDDAHTHWRGNRMDSTLNNQLSSLAPNDR